MTISCFKNNALKISTKVSIAVLFAMFSSVLLANQNAPTPPNLVVNAFVLKDFNSRSIIAQKQGDARVEPASLTKIMTAYLVFQAIKEGKLKLEQTLAISEHAYKAEGSRMFVEPKIPVTVDELLHGMIIQSGNDATIALAEGVAYSEAEFADRMNQQAKGLGMHHTHFMNATGLPDAEHYTTANDLALLAEALISDYPKEYQRYYSVKEYTYNNIKQNNRNRLLWLDPHVDGMKTGHTDSAGYCLIASTKRDNVRRISVVLGAPSDAARATESQKLLNFGFQNYDTSLVYKKGQKISSLKVWKGLENLVDATATNDLFVTLPKGDITNVKAIMTSLQPLIAPIKKGQKIGNIQLVLNGKVIQELALVAKQDVQSAGLFGQMLDSIKLLLQ